MEETTSAEMDKVIARIQKLLARTKTDRGASEAEANTAMKMAQDMMAKYNLDMAVIEAANGEKDTTRVREELKGRAMYKWQRQLAKYVAEANFCYHLIRSESKWVDSRCDEGRWSHGHYKNIPKHIFVGRKVNVITAQLMYNYLTQTIEDGVPVENNAQRLSRSAMSWKEGCADRLCERLAAKRKDLIEKHDAKARAEEEARMSEYRARAAAQPEKPKQITGNHEYDVRSAVANMKAHARDASGDKPEADPDPDRPEANPDDVWMPAGEVVPEPLPVTALVLASLYDASEQEANYELAYGYAPGSIAQRRAEREQQEQEWREKQAKYVAVKEVAAIEAPVKVETERQRKSREKREAERYEKNRRRWARESQAAAMRETREWMKRDHNAYDKGAAAGTSIGLDIQVGARSDTKKLEE